MSRHVMTIPTTVQPHTPKLAQLGGTPPEPILSQNVRVLSRLGELLNTQKNVHFFAPPGGPPPAPPQGGSKWPNYDLFSYGSAIAIGAPNGPFWGAQKGPKMGPGENPKFRPPPRAPRAGAPGRGGSGGGVHGMASFGH